MYKKIIIKAKKVLTLLIQSEINWESVRAAIVDLIEGTEQNSEAASYRQLIREKPESRFKTFKFVPLEDNLQSLNISSQTLSLQQFIQLVYSQVYEFCIKAGKDSVAITKLFQRTNYDNDNELLATTNNNLQENLFSQIGIDTLPQEALLPIFSEAVDADPFNLAGLSFISKAWQKISADSVLWRNCSFENKREFDIHIKLRKFDVSCAKKILKSSSENPDALIKVLLLGKTDSELKDTIKHIQPNPATAPVSAFITVNSKSINLEVYSVNHEKVSTIVDFIGFKNIDIFLIFPTCCEDVIYWCDQIKDNYFNQKHLVFIVEPINKQIEELDAARLICRTSGIITWEEVHNPNNFAKIIKNSVRSVARMSEKEIAKVQHNDIEPQLNEQTINKNSVNYLPKL